MPQIAGVSYTWVPVALVPTWILVLLASRAYEPRFLGTGSEEFKRVFNASVRFVALAALFAYAAKLALSRGFLGGTLVLGTALLLLERYAARKVVHLQRGRGRWTHRVLAVGDDEHVRDLAVQLERDRYAGYRLVGGCEPEERSVRAAVAACGVDTVAVTASRGLTSAVLHQLGWSLEGAGVDLVVAPALTDVAGPRMHVRPVAGLPLLHVEQPEFSGPIRLVKGAFDRLAAVLGAAARAARAGGGGVSRSRLTSPGPVIFRQERVGRDGRLFEVLKFRTMVVDAEDRLAGTAASATRPTGRCSSCAATRG